MTMRHPEPLVVGGESVAPGETRDIQLAFSESYLGIPVSLPVRVMRAVEDGPRVFVTGAVHGDELTGIGIVRELLFDNPPALERGALMLMPVVNLYGLEAHTRYLPDRRDLNRCFPGNAAGSLSSRLARTVFQEVVRQCGFGIDFHSAAVRRSNHPNVRADVTRGPVRRLAEAFGCEIIVHSEGPKGSLRRTAVEAGTPTIVFEAGEVWRIETEMLEIGARGCLNVLRKLGMVSGAPLAPPYQVTVRKTTWVRAGQGGILSFRAGTGALVEQGQELAMCHSVFGRERHAIVSPVNGLVLSMTTMPAVKPGEPVYHLAMLPPEDWQAARKAYGSA